MEAVACSSSLCKESCFILLRHSLGLPFYYFATLTKDNSSEWCNFSDHILPGAIIKAKCVPLFYKLSPSVNRISKFETEVVYHIPMTYRIT